MAITAVITCHAQDTVCYKEITKFSKPELSFSRNCVASYIHPWLFGLTRNSESKKSVISIYKEKDTISRVLSSKYFYCSIGTTVDGNPFLIEHDHQLMQGSSTESFMCVFGVKKIYILDSLLNFIKEFRVENSLIGSRCNEGLNDDFYHSLKYLRIEKDCVILQPLPSKSSTPLCLSISKRELGFLTSYPLAYDFGNNSFKVEESYSVHVIQEGREYGYDDDTVDIKGNISSNLINSSLSFIKGGFVTQLENGDIVFYKFCD